MGVVRMISEDKLIGWLVFYRHQSINDVERVSIPTHISGAFVERGWITVEDEPDWEGDHGAKFTPAGLAVTDLNAAEYGIDAIPEETNA